MPSHHITLSDQELQLLDQVRIRMGLVTIDQTIEVLAKNALTQQADCGPNQPPSNQGEIGS